MTRIALRPRAFLRVAGPDAESLLQRLISNDAAALATGGCCEALLLTPKARVIAPLVVLRRAPEDFLLLTEPELGERVRSQLTRFRLAARVEIEPEEHASHVLFDAEAPAGALTVPNADYGEPAVEVVGATPAADAELLGVDELELLRIRARTPRYGREIDDRVLPAEAGLVERAVSFSKGCYPGQEPVARLHHRGHANRGLRVLELAGDELPGYDAAIRHGGRVVGRLTSAVRGPEGVVALGYVRLEVPPDAELEVGAASVAARADAAAR